MRTKDFQENWETREGGYPPIKGEPSKDDKLKA